MGCTQSKIENEEAVTRCKERKLFMKEAVSSRNAFAAAHSAYAMSLKNTGAALSDYAQGEVQFSSASSATVPVGSSTTIPQPPFDTLPPPPPPLPNFPPNPLQRAASMPEFVIPKAQPKHSDTIIEEENEDDLENDSTHSLKHRSSKSSGGGGVRSGISHRGAEDDGLAPPPSPPPTRPQTDRAPPPPPGSENKGMTWDYFFPEMENVPGTNLADVENRIEREELERKVFEERSRRSEIDCSGESGGSGKSGKVEADVVDRKAELPPQQPPPAGKVVKRVKQLVPTEGKRKAGSSVNLLQIFSELDDCFLKASESAHEVSKMLEANRLHYHSNFADNRGHIDHSKRVMRVITWNRSFRGLSTADDGDNDFDSEEQETHATVLDKMLAWEKKLYDEVKAGEQMKLEYQRKVASLNKLKKRGTNTEASERMKSAVSHLHTRYIVDMQAMDSTVSEINRLRDEQLYPKLVALVDGMVTMWDTMRVQHESQSKIAQALRSLDISQSPKETTEHHHERTVQLWAVVQEWHSQFEKLFSNQKCYIKGLNKWLKLNLISIDNNLKEKVSSPQRPQIPPIEALLRGWQDYLEKLPDEIAKTAIISFAGVINAIVQYQIEEMQMRDKCKDTRKELARKTQQFEDWYNKYTQRRTPPDEMDPERAQDKDLVAERQAVLEIIKSRLQEEEEAYNRQCIQVREKSLTSLKTRLPELFLAMSDFSRACSDMYTDLGSISTHHRES
ncbi:unnamed protein product [Ilex paraguariensis]|uniref:Nitrate regulatory gene2 protein-like n=1 Tax=Ilex paraguariensis TaxID=185542 RepID=A0ABC8UXC9_9AQUA